MDQAVEHATKPTLIDAEGALHAHEYVVWNLKRLTINALKEVGQETNISWRTLQKIRSGESADPSISNIEKLANYFRRENARAAGTS